MSTDKFLPEKYRELYSTSTIKSPSKHQTHPLLRYYMMKLTKTGMNTLPVLYNLKLKIAPG